MFVKKPNFSKEQKTAGDNDSTQDDVFSLFDVFRLDLTYEACAKHIGTVTDPKSIIKTIEQLFLSVKTLTSQSFHV